MFLTYTVLALLALAGGAFSFYFLQVYRGGIHPDVWWIPRICHMAPGTCKVITDTPYGRLLGQPNAFWGCLFYPLLLLVVVLTVVYDAGFDLLVFLSAVSLFLSVYLIWGLIQLRTLCRVCIAVHVVNFLFFAVLMTAVGT